MPQPRNMIGPQIRRIRTTRELSQRELALMLQVKGWDISRDTLAKIEDQRRWVSDFELCFLAEILGVQVVTLFPNPKDDPARRYIQVLEKRLS